LSKAIIIDSSPLIVLLKSDLENILPELFEEIFLPEAVREEILSGQEDDIAKQKLPLLSWIRQTSPQISRKNIEDYNLGKGETAVLNIALEIPEARIILDDHVARKCAKDLQLSFIGTGGLLILAKQKGLIPTVSDALTRVQNEGLWLSDAIIEMLKEKAGE
jgi:predicted nucleic acid-binding protein